MNYKFNNVYLHEKYIIGSELEKEGPLGSYLDEVIDNKYDCFESKEIEMVRRVVKNINVKYEVVLGGDLSNQLTDFYFALKDLDVSVIGLYSACSTMNLSMILASLILESNKNDSILCLTSSCNQTAERQFRYPNEYGGAKVDTQTFTSTISSGIVLKSDKSSVRLACATVGKIVDIEYKNALDFGRVMAPAAIETVLNHLEFFNRRPNHYDLIVTGDLGEVGSKIFKEELEKVYGKLDNYNDCGLMIYDIFKQDVFSGGSGPGTVSFVTLGYIYSNLKNKLFSRVLILATGALMNQDMVTQKRSIPGICHAIELEIV